jgi:curved DNA-binding protein
MASSSVRFQDYYQTLGVARTATADEIKRSYRKLALEWHPDRHPPNKRKEAEQRFKQIAEAYEVLSDPEKRKRYDSLGANWRHGQDFQAPPGGGYRTVSPEEFARMFGGLGGAGGRSAGGFSDFFAQMFGDLFQGGGAETADGGPAAARRRTAVGHGDDVEAELELSVGEALLGGKRSLELSAAIACGQCDGSGRRGRHLCPACGGLGRTQVQKRVDLVIPKDVHDGQVLRLRGLGEPGDGGNGDLLLQVRLVSDDVYRLRGDDVEAEVVVAPWEAVAGTKVEVRVPTGVAVARIPPGSAAGTRLRLRGQGLARQDGGRGDLLLAVRIGLPEHLSARQRELLQELQREGGSVRGGARIG